MLETELTIDDVESKSATLRVGRKKKTNKTKSFLFFIFYFVKSNATFHSCRRTTRRKREAVKSRIKRQWAPLSSSSSCFPGFKSSWERCRNVSMTPWPLQDKSKKKRKKKHKKHGRKKKKKAAAASQSDSEQDWAVERPPGPPNSKLNLVLVPKTSTADLQTRWCRSPPPSILPAAPLFFYFWEFFFFHLISHQTDWNGFHVFFFIIIIIVITVPLIAVPSETESPLNWRSLFLSSSLIIILF